VLIFSGCATWPSLGKCDRPVKKKKYGIVIPCYNEDGNLPQLILECEEIARCGLFQFVLVDNGSSDTSSKILDGIQNPNITVLSLNQNKGYGGGILAGLRLLETDFVGWIHADLQTSVIDTLTCIQNHSFTFFKGIRAGRTLTERFFSMGMSVICSMLFRTSLIDINAQPTLMKRDLFESWKVPPEDFSLDLYALISAKRNEEVILRLKFNFGDRKAGSSSWNFGVQSRVKMVVRTLNYAFSLYRKGVR
jgi:glycosyltransferase involved in cell wall biosynthesis